MLEALPPIEVLTPSALLGITILAIITGRLVPRKTYEDKEHEANEWRTQCRITEQRAQELMEQNNILARDLVPLVTRFFDAIHPKKSGGRP